MFNQPLQLRGLALRNRLILAPMAGISDIPFRRICQEFGAGLTYVEMLNTLAVLSRSGRPLEMMARHPSESVLGVQLAGRSPETVGRAVALLDSRGFDTIDINMGCPARKIVASDCGSALLRTPERISASVAAARAATARPLSAKFRLGFDRPDCSVEDTVRRVVAAGVDMFTIHGRFRDDSYNVRVDHDAIRRGIRAAPSGSAASVGNGDIMDLGSARAMAENTGCDALMISRGALGNPWIFREILEDRTVSPTVAEWEDVVLRHIAYQEEWSGGHPHAALRLRKHLIWYVSGYPGSSQVRKRINTVSSLDEARAVVREFASRHPRDLCRAAGRKVQAEQAGAAESTAL